MVLDLREGKGGLTQAVLPKVGLAQLPPQRGDVVSRGPQEADCLCMDKGTSARCAGLGRVVLCTAWLYKEGSSAPAQPCRP